MKNKIQKYNLKFEKATLSDLPDLNTLYDNAREYMRKNGNPNQWGSRTPSEKLLKDDIHEKQLLVIRSENGTFEGAFVLKQTPDPWYENIDGKWITDNPYYVIHRCATMGNIPRLFDAMVEYSFNQFDEIRIDTHEDNKAMQNAILRNGFTYCGIIDIPKVGKRLAYSCEKKDYIKSEAYLSRMENK